MAEYGTAEYRWNVLFLRQRQLLAEKLRLIRSSAFPIELPGWDDLPQDMKEAIESYFSEKTKP